MQYYTLFDLLTILKKFEELENNLQVYDLQKSTCLDFHTCCEIHQKWIDNAKKGIWHSEMNVCESNKLIFISNCGNERCDK